MYAPPETILVPLDASKLAAAAVDYAIMLASATGASIILYTAIAGDEEAALHEFAHYEGIAIDEAADAYLHRVAGSIPDNITVVRRHGHSHKPAAAIVDFAIDNGVSMIVMASHGRSGVARWRLGSVTTRVLATSPIPVTVIPVRS
ncbi:MAG: universal stress protein [Actinomycetota bacterium]